MRLPLGQSAALGRTFIDLSLELTTAVLRTIEAGWPIVLARDEVTVHANEVTVTECLRDAMRLALTQHRLPWRKTMIVAPGTESRSRADLVSPDGRTDIPLFLTRVFVRSGEHDPHVILECKRVAEGDAALLREYVVEGIDRFRTGKYAENHRRGFMVGYVIAGTGVAVVSGINRYLSGRSRQAEILLPATLAGGSGWESEHPRASNGSVLLHHAMLPVA